MATILKKHIREIQFSTKQELIEKLGKQQRGLTSSGDNAFRNSEGELFFYSKELGFNPLHFTGNGVDQNISLSSSILSDIQKGVNSYSFWSEDFGTLKTTYNYLEIGGYSEPENNIVIDITEGINIPQGTFFTINNSNPFDNYVLLSEKGSPSGVAELDENGKVKTDQLPTSIMDYKGSWDASTNIPVLQDGVGSAGDVYLVSVEGTQNLGSGDISFYVNDWVIYNGSIWEKSKNSSEWLILENVIKPKQNKIVSTNGNVLRLGNSELGTDQNGDIKYDTDFRFRKNDTWISLAEITPQWGVESGVLSPIVSFDTLSIDGKSVFSGLMYLGGLDIGLTEKLNLKSEAIENVLIGFSNSNSTLPFKLGIDSTSKGVLENGDFNSSLEIEIKSGNINLNSNNVFLTQIIETSDRILGIQTNGKIVETGLEFSSGSINITGNYLINGSQIGIANIADLQTELTNLSNSIDTKYDKTGGVIDGGPVSIIGTLFGNFLNMKRLGQGAETQWIVSPSSSLGGFTGDAIRIRANTTDVLSIGADGNLWILGYLSENGVLLSTKYALKVHTHETSDINGFSSEVLNEVSVFGIGLTGQNTLGDVNDFNLAGGLYSTGSTTNNVPLSENSGTLLNIRSGVGGGAVGQLWIKANNDNNENLFVRHCDNTGTFKSWQEIWHKGKFGQTEVDSWNSLVSGGPYLPLTGGDINYLNINNDLQVNGGIIGNRFQTVDASGYLGDGGSAYSNADYDTMQIGDNSTTLQTRSGIYFKSRSHGSSTTYATRLVMDGDRFGIYQGSGTLPLRMSFTPSQVSIHEGLTVEGAITEAGTLLTNKYLQIANYTDCRDFGLGLNSLSAPVLDYSQSASGLKTGFYANIGTTTEGAIVGGVSNNNVFAFGVVRQDTPHPASIYVNHSWGAAWKGKTELWHEGNFDPADYLPLTGGDINYLNINNNLQVNGNIEMIDESSETGYKLNLSKYSTSGITNATLRVHHQTGLDNRYICVYENNTGVIGYLRGDGLLYNKGDISTDEDISVGKLLKITPLILNSGDFSLISNGIYRYYHPDNSHINVDLSSATDGHSYSLELPNVNNLDLGTIMEISLSSGKLDVDFVVRGYYDGLNTQGIYVSTLSSVRNGLLLEHYYGYCHLKVALIGGVKRFLCLHGTINTYTS